MNVQPGHRDQHGMWVGSSEKSIDTSKPGIHTVTYLNPQFVSLLREYYGPEEVESILARSLQRVYVAPGKSVTVNLWWKPYEKYLVAQKRWGWIKMAVGFTVASMLLVLNI